MLEISLNNEFHHPLAIITTIGLTSLIYCETIDILAGNKAFLSGLFERNRIKTLRSVLADKSLDWYIRKVASDQLDSIAYEYATGIRARKEIQQRIVYCVRSAKGRLEYSDFRKALPWLQITPASDLEVRKIGLGDKIIQFYWLIMIGMALLFAYHLFGSLVSENLSSGRAFHLCIAIAFQVATIFAYAYQMSRLNSARKIAREINTS